jgi:hypothetical protein
VKAFGTHPQEWTARVLAFLDAHLTDGAGR